MILVFGGTTEGRLAAQCLDVSGSQFFYSTKSGLQNISLHNGTIMSGCMECNDIVQFCRDNAIRLIVDAAHPYAEQLRQNILDASIILEVPVIRYERLPLSNSLVYDNIVWCSSFSHAAEMLLKQGIKKVLALSGVNTIKKLKSYWGCKGNCCYFRILNRKESIEIATNEGFDADKLLFFDIDRAKGDGFAEDEVGVINSLGVEAIITKESGESGYFAEKITAAARCGIKVFVVKRPLVPKSFFVVYGPIGLRKLVENIVPTMFKLKIGFTTGSCAVAAAKRAVKLLCGITTNSDNLKNPDGSAGYVNVSMYKDWEYIHLPSGEMVMLPISSALLVRDLAICNVVKDSGDDPDVTNGIIIKVSAVLNDTGKINLLRGEGVGVVTLPGLGLEIGAPAINNIPRKMIEFEVRNVLHSYSNFKNGVDITIEVPKGRELANRTFNPKLGIKDGISIIGTSGVVRPFSKDAFIGSIKKEIEVAIALGSNHIILNSGAKSDSMVKKFVCSSVSMAEKNLPEQAFIHYGNFIGEAIKVASSFGVDNITLGIMLGKAVKLAEGNLDTHSKLATLNKVFIRELAVEAGCSVVPNDFTMARELWEIFNDSDAHKFFPLLLNKCYEQCRPLFKGRHFTIFLIPDSSCPNAEFFYCSE